MTGGDRGQEQRAAKVRKGQTGRVESTFTVPLLITFPWSARDESPVKSVRGGEVSFAFLVQEDERRRELLVTPRPLVFPELLRPTRSASLVSEISWPCFAAAIATSTINLPLLMQVSRCLYY